MKPANILIDKKGNPYVVDFGVARMEMSTMTSTGAIIGTPSYMAPEQVMGKQVDSRADVFALGVIFFELLTGKRPFEGEHITTVAYKIIHEDPPTLKEINKDIPQEFEDIVRKSIAKNPDERFQTCREMADALLKQTQSYAETIPFNTTETVFSGVRTEKKRKLKPVAVVIPVVGILVGAMGAYLFLPGVRQLFTSGGGMDNITLPFAARQVLLDTGEREIQEFGRPVQRQGTQHPRNQSQISQNYAAGISSYNQGDYRKSAQYMTEVLKLDSQNSDAKRYLNLANSALDSIRNIRTLIERQRKAEEEKELPLLLNDLGSVDLYQQKSAEMRGFFNKYDEIKSIVDVGKIQINFEDMNNARVSFPKLVSAVDKETRGRSIVFEGQVTWIMQKQAAGWKIIDLQSKSF
jgi:tetratricopeptide (TPR) repeat protein